MARKTVPAHPTRDRTRDDESLLLRSAESLGRMIGSLQRELDVVTGRVAAGKPNGRAKASASSARRSANANSGTARTRSGMRRKSAARKTVKKR